MRRVLGIVLVLAVTGVMSSASAQPVGYRNRPDVGPIDTAMRRAGPVVTPESVGPGEIAGTMPFAYRRPAVLKTAASSSVVYDSGIKIPAGSPGFFVGRGDMSDFNLAAVMELWCFQPSKVGGKQDLFCLYLGPVATAFHTLPRGSRYWPDTMLANARRLGNTVGPTPELEYREVEILPNPTLQYRFLKWNRKGAAVEFLVGGDVVRGFSVPFEADGSVSLGLLAGGYLQLRKDPSDPTRAMPEFVAAGARYEIAPLDD